MSWEMRIVAERIWVRVQEKVTLHSKGYFLLGLKNKLDNTWCWLHALDTIRIIED
jgi:hypothetical protein